MTINDERIGQCILCHKNIHPYLLIIARIFRSIIFIRVHRWNVLKGKKGLLFNFIIEYSTKKTQIVDEIHKTIIF